MSWILIEANSLLILEHAFEKHAFHPEAWVFSCKFAAYFQNTFSYEHLWSAASICCFVFMCLFLRTTGICFLYNYSWVTRPNPSSKGKEIKETFSVKLQAENLRFFSKWRLKKKQTAQIASDTLITFVKIFILII